MRLGISLLRANQYPWVAGVVQAARARGHGVTIISEWVQLRIPVDRVLVAPDWPRVGAFDAILSVSLDPPPGLLARVMTHLQICSWSYRDLARYNRYRRRYVWAPGWGTTPWGPGGGESLAVGPAIADQLGPERPRDAFVVLPLPRPWAPLGWKIGPEPVLFALQCRRLARRARLKLVLKVRKKHRVPLTLRAVADEIVDDSRPWEATCLHLMQRARVMVHFYSSAVVEAMLADVPTQMCVSLGGKRMPAYAERLRHTDFSAPARRAFQQSNGESFYDFGDSQSVMMARCGPSWSLGVSTFLGLKTLPLGSTDISRAAYREKFLGGEVKHVGERIVDDLERLVRKAG